MTRARFDKSGRRLPDTGRGCGCGLCEEAQAPRYERRSDATRDDVEWGALHRRLARMVRALSRMRGAPRPEASA